jgi:hypothetical protein
MREETGFVSCPDSLKVSPLVSDKDRESSVTVSGDRRISR